METRNPDDYELFLEGILEAPRGQRKVWNGLCYNAAYKCSPTIGSFPCAGNVCYGPGGVIAGAAAGCGPGGCPAPVPAAGPAAKVVVGRKSPGVPVTVAPASGSQPEPVEVEPAEPEGPSTRKGPGNLPPFARSTPVVIPPAEGPDAPPK